MKPALSNASLSRLSSFIPPALFKPANFLLLMIGLCVAAIIAALVVSRFIAAPVEAALADDAGQVYAAPDYSMLTAADREALTGIEIRTGRIAASLAAGDLDPAGTLASLARISADAGALGSRVPAAFRKSLVDQSAEATSLIHKGHTAEALPILRRMQGSLTSARSASL